MTLCHRCKPHGGCITRYIRRYGSARMKVKDIVLVVVDTAIALCMLAEVRIVGAFPLQSCTECEMSSLRIFE